MSRGEPVLTQLMVRYPFTPHSRQFFDKLPIEESFSSGEVVKQAESRLLSSIGRIRYERHLSELIEFSSFFVAAIVASQNAYLGQKFAERESESAKRLFIKEEADDKPAILKECFGVLVLPGEVASGRGYVMRVEDYLGTVTKFEMNKSPRWKLVNQPLTAGFVRLSENIINDFFGDLSERMIYEGVRNLRRVQFPKQLSGLRERILPYLPPPKVDSRKGYVYVEELLKHPVSDGRHRFVWLVLAPYLVNVRKVEEVEAIERIRAFVAAKGETSAMKRFIEYNVKRARRNGLMPPTLNKLKTEHPDLYSLLPKEAAGREKQGPR